MRKRRTRANILNVWTENVWPAKCLGRVAVQTFISPPGVLFGRVLKSLPVETNYDVQTFENVCTGKLFKNIGPRDPNFFAAVESPGGGGQQRRQRSLCESERRHHIITLNNMLPRRSDLENVVPPAL